MRKWEGEKMRKWEGEKVKENNAVPEKRKLSERFAGCLSKERTEELQQELVQMRKEWERDI